ncbi:MAG: helix-turn-helix transcriptional regulator [Coriobacteriia bacterium]|nr:helix-turn-helix transcriptional regulator [Coriobacteriia bacterium]
MNTPGKQLHKYGPWFRNRRKVAELTQKALSEAVGVDRSYVAQIEAGSRWPSKPTLYAIFAAMGVPLAEALTELRLVENDEAERIILFTEFIEEIAPHVAPKRLAAFQEMFANDQERYRWVGQFALSEPLPPAPDGWIRLTKEDRRLVQRFVNRLLDSYPKEEPHADQAE